MAPGAPPEHPKKAKMRPSRTRNSHSRVSILSKSGDVAFWVAGNMVNGDGAPNADDHWNTLSFIVNSPSETSASSDQSTRVISSGDHSLFDQEVDAEALEIEHQKAISEAVMDTGVTWFFITLTALLVGAIVQKEILERKYDTGPAHLDRQLAYPEGLRRGWPRMYSPPSSMSMNWQSVELDCCLSSVWPPSFGGGRLILFSTHGYHPYPWALQKEQFRFTTHMVG